MGQLTEAACLIDQGAIFPNRIGFRGADGHTVLIGFKPGACSIYFDDEPIYHFDLEGRWQRAFIGADPTNPATPANLAGVPGTHYLKALDTTTTSLQRLREGNEIKIHRNRLNFAETVDMDDHVRQMAMDLHHRIATGLLKPVSPPSTGRTAGRAVDLPEILDFLERIATWESSAWSRQKERFESTFGILPMTPPSLPGPLVLQPLIGDSDETPVGFGGSATCPIYLRDRSEFHRHLENVKHLWHRRLTQARGIYLAGSEVIHQPMPQVLEILEEVEKNLAELTIDLPGRVIDPPPTPQKTEIHMLTYSIGSSLPTVEMLAEYRQRGLAQLTIGIESASLAVREQYGRKWNETDLVNFIKNCNEAGLKYSMVLLVGAGGSAHPENFDQTRNFIDSLPLETGTIIYLLDAAETATSNWQNKMQIGESNATELYTLRDRLAAHLKEREIRVTHYTLEKEWQ